MSMQGLHENCYRLEAYTNQKQRIIELRSQIGSTMDHQTNFSAEWFQYLVAEILP